jgi:hypothetical protein
VCSRLVGKRLRQRFRFWFRIWLRFRLGFRLRFWRRIDHQSRWVRYVGDGHFTH